MKRLLLSALFSIIGFSLLADPVWFHPHEIQQPDGSTFDCFLSGDEFFNWIHDADGHSIIKGPGGYYYYAERVDDKIVASEHRITSTKAAISGLEKWVIISNEEYQQRRESFFISLNEGGTKSTSLEDYPVSAAPIGTINNIVIYIRFAGEEELETTRDNFDVTFNSLSGPSVRDYYQEVSYNNLTFISTHYPVCANPSTTNASYVDSHPREYFQVYDADNNPIGYQDGERSERERQLLVDAINWVNQNSPVPSNIDLDNDNDDIIDCVSFIFKGSPEGWSELLWAHRSGLSHGTAYINGISVGGYTFQPETSSQRTFNHELFHVLGAPDLYHYSLDYRSFHPVYRWDIMEYGSGHMGAYMKWKYTGNNWISSIPEITSSGTYTLNPITSPTNNCYRITSPYSSNEFFVVEYRRQLGEYESTLDGEGLLVYRINTDFRGNAGFDNSTRFDEVYIYRPNGTISEDGQPQNANMSEGVGRTQINDSSNPSSFLHDGSNGGLNITSVSQGGNTISFTINIDSDNCDDSYESNNTISTATTSVFSTLGNSGYDESLSATIHDVSDDDFYRLNVSVAGRIIATLPNPPENYDLELLNASGQVVASSSTSGSESLTYHCMGNATGYYYIRVYGYNGANSCSPYTLGLEWDAYYMDVSPNSRTVGASAGSTSFTVDANVAWDVSDDASWLTATETNSSTISVTYSANNTNSTRTAYITVSAYGGETETVTVVQPTDIDCDDSYESNNTISTATTSVFSTLGNSGYDESLSATIHDVSDDDFYRLNVSVAGRIIVTLPNPPENYDLELLNASGQVVASSSTSGSESLTYHCMGNATGYYYIRVYGYNGANSCTPYTLGLEWDAYYMDVSPNSRTVGTSAGSTSFTVDANVAWDVSDDASWLTATETNSSTISVTYSANNNSTTRTAYITVSAYGGSSETVTVTQSGAGCNIEVTPSSRSVGASAGTTSFSVSSNVSWSISHNESWLSASISGSTINVEYNENSSTSSRTGTITISGDGCSETVTVTQSGADCNIDVTPSSRSVEASAGTTSFSVSSNVSWSVSHNESWLSASISGSTINVDYNENSSTSSRTGTITISGDGCSETVTVNQSGADCYINVSPPSLSVDANSGKICFSVTSNVSWSVSVNESWLSTSISGSTVCVYYSENLSTSSRTATITISGDGCSETVTVTQSGNVGYPNLTSYQPSNWEDRIVVSSVKDTHSDSDAIQDQVSYIDFAFTNNGNDDAGNHKSCIYLDSEPIRCIELNGMPVNFQYKESDWEYTFTESGWHTIKIILDIDDDVIESDNGDNTYQKQIYVKSPTSVDEYNHSDFISLYPNPSNGKFNLEIQNSVHKRYNIEIIDAAGKAIWKNQIEMQGLKVRESIDLSGSPSGIYFIKVYNNDFNGVKKLILFE